MRLQTTETFASLAATVPPLLLRLQLNSPADFRRETNHATQNSPRDKWHIVSLFNQFYLLLLPLFFNFAAVNRSIMHENVLYSKENRLCFVKGEECTKVCDSWS